MIREKSLFIIRVCIKNEIQDELTLYNYNLIRNSTIIGELVPTSAPLLNKRINGNVYNCEIIDFLFSWAWAQGQVRPYSKSKRAAKKQVFPLRTFSLYFFFLVEIGLMFSVLEYKIERNAIFLSPMLSVGQQPTTKNQNSSLLVQEGVSFCPVWRESFILNQSCLNWRNSLILHNSSGYAFSSLLSIFSYAMMEMEYLGSAEF